MVANLLYKSVLLVISFIFLSTPVFSAQPSKNSKTSKASKTKYVKAHKASRKSKKPKKRVKLKLQVPKISNIQLPRIKRPNPLNYPMTGQSLPVMKGFDQALLNFMARWRMPGAAVAIIKEGKLVYARGYGYSDEVNKHPVLPYSLFRIASVSKAFTAVAVMKLVQDGRLRLDDPAFKILSDIKPLPGRNINPNIYRITVKDLLQISSGWAAGRQGGFDPMFGPWPVRFSQNLPEATPASCFNTTRLMMTWPMSYKPGTRQSYTNLDYCILGLIVDKVTGSPYGYAGYEHYVLNHVLKPIGIQDMRIGSTRWSEKKWNEVRYYRSPRNVSTSTYLPYSNQDILKKNFSNGGWIASAPDVAKFVYALSQGRILRPPYLEQMLAAPSFKAGQQHYFSMGLKVFKLPEKKDYWVLTGSFTGTNAFVVKRANGTVVVVLFNARTDAGSHFASFRPQIKQLMMSNKIPF